MDVLIFLQPLLSGEENQLGGPITSQPHPESEEQSRGGSAGNRSREHVGDGAGAGAEAGLVGTLHTLHLVLAISQPSLLTTHPLAAERGVVE